VLLAQQPRQRARHIAVADQRQAGHGFVDFWAASRVACRVAVKPSRSMVCVDETKNLPMIGGRPRVSEVVSHST
jgi:hypothetical protein